MFSVVPMGFTQLDRDLFYWVENNRIFVDCDIPHVFVAIYNDGYLQSVHKSPCKVAEFVGTLNKPSVWAFQKSALPPFVDPLYHSFLPKRIFFMVPYDTTDVQISDGSGNWHGMRMVRTVYVPMQSGISICMLPANVLLGEPGTTYTNGAIATMYLSSQQTGDLYLYHDFDPDFAAFDFFGTFGLLHSPGTDFNSSAYTIYDIDIDSISNPTTIRYKLEGESTYRQFSVSSISDNGIEHIELQDQRIQWVYQNDEQVIVYSSNGNTVAVFSTETGEVVAAGQDNSSTITTSGNYVAYGFGSYGLHLPRVAQKDSVIVPTPRYYTANVVYNGVDYIVITGVGLSSFNARIYLNTGYAGTISVPSALYTVGAPDEVTITIEPIKDSAVPARYYPGPATTVRLDTVIGNTTVEGGII
ncbi:MAG: hypothetical protein D6735_00130 [Acidobacteria bacterium]|nr:MAG: hypothetical protein D6735_00130 [Acidobacteriota bacterium]